VSNETDVQKIIKQADAEDLAKARLVQLFNEGVVTGLGVGQRDNRELVFVAINSQLLSSDHVELNTFRARLKEALQEIPFEILGHYNDSPANTNSPVNHTFPAAASPELSVQHERPSNEMDEATLSSSDAPRRDSTPTEAGVVPVSSPEVSSHEAGGRPIILGADTVSHNSRGLIVMMFLVAVGGWSAFAYAIISGDQRQRSYRDDLSRVTMDRDKLNSDLNGLREEAEYSRHALERTQADLVSARAQLQATPPPTTRDEIRRILADREKLSAELTQMRADAERNRLALERAQAELAGARAQSEMDPPLTAPQAPAPSPAPSSRSRPRR
jgi:hypothetical protein